MDAWFANRRRSTGDRSIPQVTLGVIGEVGPEDTVTRLDDALQHFPENGQGVHQHLYRCACLGHDEGWEPEALVAHIMENLPDGCRFVPITEVQSAVSSSAPGCRLGPVLPRVSPAEESRVRDLADALARQGRGATVESIAAGSPCPIPADPTAAFQTVLARLYAADDILWMGDVRDANRLHVKPVEQWFDLGPKHPHLIINPVCGYRVPGKSGKLSYRCDAAVAARRFAVVEFDKAPLVRQLAWWAGVLATGYLNVAALVFSGSKSIHGWIRPPDGDVWLETAVHKLFGHLLVPMGADSTCHNASRLTRTPGAYRADKQHRQDLLYLA